MERSGFRAGFMEESGMFTIAWICGISRFGGHKPRDVFLSQGYFTRAFVHEMGMSPMNYLMKKRIERACSLLENNEIKVSAISLQSGFSSPQRFNVAFRKLMGMTPMEYRKRHLK